MEKTTYTPDSFSIEEAFEVADFVVVGRITQIGNDIPGGGGLSYSQGTLIDVVAVEKGNPEKSSLLINYQVWSIKDMQLVKKPEQGKEYRFYIFIRRDQNNVLDAFKICDL